MEIKSTSTPGSPRSKRYPVGSTVTGGGTTTVTGSGSTVDVLKTTSGMSPSDANVLSSLRSIAEIRNHLVPKDDAGRELTDINTLSSLRALKEIEERALSRLKDDRAAGSIEFEKNITVGKTATTLNLLVQELAKVYDLEVDHVATMFRTIVKDYISSETYIPGMMGEGMKLYKTLSGDWNLEVDNVTVRKAITTFEMIISKIRSINGGLVISVANGTVKSVAETMGDPAYYILGIEGDMTFAVNDLVRCQVFTSGRTKYYWAPIEQINGDSILLLKSSFPEGVTPAEGDELVQMGNRTDTNRQGALYLTASEDGKPRFSVLDGINSPTLAGKNKVILGCLDGITDTDFPADYQPSGHGLYAMNVFLKGLFILRNGKSVDGALSELSSQIDAIPGQISLKVTEEVGNMQLGGRNLLKNSRDIIISQADSAQSEIEITTDPEGFKVTKIRPSVGAIDSNAVYRYSVLTSNLVSRFVIGQDYVLSADVCTNNNISQLQFDIRRGTYHNREVIVFDLPDTGGEWRRVFVPVKFTSSAPADWDAFLFSITCNTTDTSCYSMIKAYQIQIGTKGAGWNESVHDAQIGGRNYYKKSSQFFRLYETPTIDQNHPDCPNGVFLIGSSSGNSAVRVANVINSDGYWTVSFDLRGSQNSTIAAFDMNVCDGVGVNPIITPDNNWRHHEYTVHVDNYSTLPNVFNFVDFENLAWAYIYIRNLKIEKGNKATDWTPAPEDIEYSLTQTGIDITNRKIVATSDKFVVQDNAGNQMAVFENGKIRADRINAGQIVADGINASDIYANRLKVQGNSKIAGFNISGDSLSSGPMTLNPRNLSFSESGVYAGFGPGSGPGVIGLDVPIWVKNESYSDTCIAAHLSATGAYDKFNNIALSLNGCISGHAIRVKQINDSNNYYTIGSEGFVSCYNTGRINIYLPSSPCVGREVTIKRMNNAHIEVYSGTYKIYTNGVYSSVGINDRGEVQRYVFDGQYWNRTWASG